MRTTRVWWWWFDGADAWIITGGTETGVCQFVGEAARDYRLQNGNNGQKLAVIGIAALGLTANNELISSGSCSTDTASRSEVVFTARRLAKRGICRRRVSVRQSLCLFVSVTLRYCVKTAKRRITQIMPYDRDIL